VAVAVAAAQEEQGCPILNNNSIGNKGK